MHEARHRCGAACTEPHGKQTVQVACVNFDDDEVMHATCVLEALCVAFPSTHSTRTQSCIYVKLFFWT